MAEFWPIVEKNTAIRVPKHLQRILKLHGYDDASSIKSITTEDINSLEEFVQNGIEVYIGENDDPKDFYHIYYDMKSRFKITNGDRVKLMSAVNFVKEKLASEAGHRFFHQSEKIIQSPSIESLPFQQNNRLSSGDNFVWPKLDRCLSNPTRITSLENVCHTPTPQIPLMQSKSEFIDLTSPADTSVIIIDEEPVDNADQLTKKEGAIDNEQNVAIIGEPEFSTNEMPACQGCQKVKAQCVCVGSDNKQNITINVGPEVNKKEMPSCHGCQMFKAQCVCLGSDNKQNITINVGPEVNKKEMPSCHGCQTFKAQCVCVRFDCQCFCNRQGPIFCSSLRNYPNVHWKKALMLRNKTDILNGTVTTDRRNLRYA